jgi:SAM-dependent methyltransferase
VDARPARQPATPFYARLRSVGKSLYLRLKRLRARHLSSVDTRGVWQKGLPDEIWYWEDFLSTGGLEWPDEFKRRTSCDSLVIDPLLAAELDRSPLTSISILDVGAGPLTVVGTRYPGKELSVTAVDPLGAEYDALLERYKITPPVRTVTGAAEELTTRFAPESFDFAYARNSLDHSYDPVKAIDNMIRVTKKSGKVLLRHHAHEAENAKYFGLHQWNFEVDQGCFVIWARGVEHNITELFAKDASLSCVREKEWILCTIARKP